MQRKQMETITVMLDIICKNQFYYTKMTISTNNIENNNKFVQFLRILSMQLIWLVLAGGKNVVNCTLSTNKATSPSLFLMHLTSSSLLDNQQLPQVHQKQSYDHDHSYQSSEFVTEEQGLFGLTSSAENNNNNIAKSKDHETTDYYYPDSPQLTQDQISTNSNNNNNINHNDFSDANQLSILNHFNRLPDKEYLSHDVSEKACRLDRGCQRKDRLNNTYLSYCTRYKLENLLSSEILMSIMHDSSEECEKILDEFIQLDELINQFDRLFKNLLTRYNCHNGYSVKWSCEDCKKAYKDWLCATNLPYYMNGERIKPCISFCERVEQRCPYLHPITKEQYGGQPVFICRDPNIPFVPKITPDIPYSEPSKCYDLCHLSENLTELIADSLSKYEYDKCPDKGDLAEEVRSDPLYCRLDNNNNNNNNQQHQQSNQSKTSLSSSTDDIGFDPSTVSSDYQSNDSTVLPANQSHVATNNKEGVNDHNKATTNTHGAAFHLHNKKLHELREVLTIYKSQPKTHKFGHLEHSSLVQTTHGTNNMMLHHHSEPQSSW